MLATCGWERAIKIWEPIREGHLSDKKEEIQEVNISKNFLFIML